MSATWWRIGLMAMLLLWSPRGQTQEPRAVHGADSLFQMESARVAWAVLRGSTEDRTLVVIRVVNLASAFRHLRVDGVDPFTKDRAVLVEARPLAERADLAVPRARFADHPSAEIHLFASADALRADKPDLVIYYLGVPDTTPEFQARGELDAYLDKMTGAAK